jgi:hypothetical protein
MRCLRGEITGLSLSRKSLAAMLRPQLPDQAEGGEFVGLGWFCSGEGDAFRFGHGGGNHGFLADLRLYPATGQGAAVTINSHQGWPLLEELLHAIEREYGWPIAAHATSDTSTPVHLAGTYRDSADRVFRVEQAGDTFLLWVGDQDPIRLIPSSDGVLSSQMPEIRVRLAHRAEGSPSITLTQGGRTFEAVKAPEELPG